MPHNQPTSYFDSPSPHYHNPRSIFDPPPPCIPSNSTGRSPTGLGLQRRRSLVHRPPPAFTRPNAHPQYPSSPRRRTRPRVFSAPSFEHRVTTSEVERGRFVGSACSSRSVSAEGPSTRVSPALWNSVFQAMQQDLKRGSSATSIPAMSRVGSRASMMSTTSMAQYDQDDPRLTGKLKDKSQVDLPSR
jgi:hypothetical protein